MPKKKILADTDDEGLIPPISDIEEAPKTAPPPTQTDVPPVPEVKRKTKSIPPEQQAKMQAARKNIKAKRMAKAALEEEEFQKRFDKLAILDYLDYDTVTQAIAMKKVQAGELPSTPPPPPSPIKLNVPPTPPKRKYERKQKTNLIEPPEEEEEEEPQQRAPPPKQKANPSKQVLRTVSDSETDVEPIVVKKPVAKKAVPAPVRRKPTKPISRVVEDTTDFTDSSEYSSSDEESMYTTNPEFSESEYESAPEPVYSSFAPPPIPRLNLYGRRRV